MSFLARYDGTCAAQCGQRIHPGDAVTYDADDRLVHEVCTPARDPLDIRPGEITCGVCFCIMPCRCVDD